MISQGLFAVLYLTSTALAFPKSPFISRSTPSWADASTAKIHPGVNTDTKGASCTSNFVYYDNNGTVYIGQAAHCSSLGGQTSTNGCDTKSAPEGTRVNVTGADYPGEMVYNSWIRMQNAGESDPDTCAYNDLALIRLNPADYDKVNPSVPVFGGPTGLQYNGLTPSTFVYSYGNSIIRQGISVLSPKYGTSLEEDAHGWSHQVGTLTPGIPGDSGSGFLDHAGLAFGVLSTVALAPIPASNGVGDLAKELAYARQFPDFLSLELALGTEKFKSRAAEKVAIEW